MHHHEDGQCHCCGCEHSCCEEKERSGRILLIGAGLFALGFVLDIWGFGIFPFIVSYILLGWRVLKAAGKSLIKGKMLDENFLMSIATLGAFAIGEIPEAVGIMLFYCIGTYFEEKAVAKSRRQIIQAIDLRPETVLLADGKAIPVELAKPGDLITIRPGDRIGLDGVVVEGAGQIDTSLITGEPLPVDVKAGDPVISGSINLTAQLTVQVEKTIEHSMVTRILHAVEKAAEGKPKINRFMTRFARVYTPVVVAIAGITAVVPSLITGQWNDWVYTALSFLVMSCPCALVLSIPLAFFSGIGAGSKRGILFKDGVSMEALSNVRVVAMDKTGTVTKGDFSVQEIWGREDVLSLCAGCEKNSTHPLAKSIVKKAGEMGVIPVEMQEMEELSGYGVRAVCGQGKVLCGNEKWMALHGVQPDTQGKEGNLVYVAVNGRCIGGLRLADTVKSNSKAAVSRLKRMGLKTVMLTGDTRENGEAVCQEVGIEKAYCRLLPQEKLAVMEEIREQQGAVMFVGDGINDSPVLSGADVGAAMGSGADAAIEAADLVFMTSDPEAIVQAIVLAKRTGRVALGNVIFALAVKALVIILGLLGYASMWMAVFADSGVAMLCILNSIAILYRKRL